MDNATRVGDGIVRHHFRTRENGDLPIGTCGDCGRETYQVPAGVWLHWSTLTGSCPVIAVSEGREGAKL